MRRAELVGIRYRDGSSEPDNSIMGGDRGDSLILRRRLVESLAFLEEGSAKRGVSREDRAPGYTTLVEDDVPRGADQETAK